VDMKLEVMVVPVSKVDKARDFDARLGWRLDVTPPTVVQFTPPGSWCSVQFGTNLTSAAPGPAKGYLIVSDIEAVRDELVAAGIEASEVYHLGPDRRVSGLAPDHRSYGSWVSFSDPDGNSWQLQEVTTRLPGRVDSAATSFGSASDLAREPESLSDALGEVMRAEGIELYLGVQATAARRDGGDYLLVLSDGRELRGDRLLAATGRRPRLPDGLDTVGFTAGPRGITVDAGLRAAERLWAIGDVTGIRLLTHVGDYQGEVVASNILGEPREAHYKAIPDVVYTDPQVAAVGATDAPFSASIPVPEVAKTATYPHAYASSSGFLTLLSDGERLTGAYALGPEAGEWLQQATLAIRACVPLQIRRDVIQPWPTFSSICGDALKALQGSIAAARESAGAGSP
jgi:hypothetical protein